MVDVITNIIINKSISAVYDYASNPDNAPEWYDNIKSVEWMSEKPLQIGSKVAFVAQFLGKRMAYTYEIIELEPNRKLTMKTSEGPFPMETIYQWFEIDEHSTKMVLQNRGKPSGFSKLFTPFMSVMMKKANNKDLKKLNKILIQDF